MSEKKEKKQSAAGRMFRTKAFRAGGYSTAAAAIVIVIAVLLNLLVSNISTAYTNIDTTQTGLFSVSEQTKDLISSLENDVTIYYIASSDYRADYVSKLLDKFASCGSKLNVKDIDPDVEPNFASQYTTDSVSNGDLLVVCGEKAQVVAGGDMVEYEAGSYEYYLYYLQNGQQTDIYWNGEVKLVKAIDYVTATETYTVYFLDTNDSGDFSTLEESLDNENIVCATLDSETDEIPSDASCVIVTDMTTDLTQKNSDALTAYLKKGGKLYLAADYNSEERTNLEALLSAYGLAFTSAILEDGDRNYNSGELLDPQITGEHAIISPFSKANYFLFPNAMGIRYEEKSGITVTPLLTTSSSAYLSTDASDNLNFDTFTLGAVVDDANTGAQLVVYGTSGYTSSAYTNSTGFANSDLFVNSVGYLCDKDSAITIHAKAITSDTTLDFSGISTGVLTALIVVLPALIAAAAGFIIWYRRKYS